MLVRSSLFGPQGTRSFGGGRGVDYQLGIRDMAEYCRNANANIFIAVMIEGQAGIDNIEEIVAVPGIDCVMIGQNDLAQDLGVTGNTNSPIVKKAVAEIAKRVRKAGGKMRDDVLVLGNLPDMLISAGRPFARPSAG
jgi:4-hydroxy-2-oxoheptanedioate aldolase